MTGLIRKPTNLPEIASYAKPEKTFYGQELILKKELNQAELELINSINYSLVRELDRSNLKDAVFIVVSGALRAIQSRMQGEDIVLLNNDFEFELSAYFPNLSIKEFEIIVRDGIRKKYDTEQIQTIGLSIANFNYWAKIYMAQKAKLNQQIDHKLNKKFLELPPEKVTKDSVINLIRQDYISIQKSFNKRYQDQERVPDFDEFWMENGMRISSSYVAMKLIDFDAINQFDILDKKKELELKGYKPDFAKAEAERIIICKLAIKLRNAKQKPDGRKKS